MAVTLLGCFTQPALDGLVQTTPPTSGQTITGDLNVTGTVTAGTVVDNGVITGDLEVTGSVDVDTDLNVDGNVVVDGTSLLSGAVTMSAALGLAADGFTMASIARTATADGTGTGTIASGPKLQSIAVTAGGDANSIIILPTPTPGHIVILSVGATGYELRSSAPATIGINGGTGASAESAIPANTTAVLICESATSWKGFQMGSDGTLAKVEVAA